MEPKKDRQTFLIVLITSVATLLVAVITALVIVLVREGSSGKKAVTAPPAAVTQESQAANTPAAPAASSPEQSSQSGSGQTAAGGSSTYTGSGTLVSLPSALADTDGQLIMAKTENTLSFSSDGTFVFDNLTASGQKERYSGTFRVYQTEGGKRTISCYITADGAVGLSEFDRTFYLYEDKKDHWIYLGKDRGTLNWHESMTSPKGSAKVQVGATTYTPGYDKEYEGVWLIRGEDGMDFALTIDSIAEGTVKGSASIGQLFSVSLDGAVLFPDHTGYLFAGYSVLGQERFLGAWLKFEFMDNTIKVTVMDFQPPKELLENIPVPVPDDLSINPAEATGVLTEHMTKEEYQNYLKSKTQPQ